MKHKLLGSLAALLLLVGCGGDDSPVDRFLGQRERIVDFCSCPSLFGQPTEQTCREVVRASYATTPEHERCLRDVYDAHSSVLEEPLSCLTDAIEAQLDCFERTLTTCPPSIDAVAACNRRYEQDADACPPVPEAALEELDACNET